MNLLKSNITPCIVFVIGMLYLACNNNRNNSDELLLPYYYQGKWGYADTNGVMKISPEFDRAGIFANNAAIVYKNNNYFLIDKNANRISKKFNGLELINKGYSHAYDIKTVNNEVISEKEIVSHKTAEIVAENVDLICKINENDMAYVSKNALIILAKDSIFESSLSDYINAGDKAVHLLNQRQGYLEVIFDNYSLIFNSLGEFMAKASLNNTYIQNGFLVYKNENGECGVLNSKKDTIVPFFAYDDLIFESDSMFLFKSKGKPCFFDAKINKYLKLNYEDVYLTDYSLFGIKDKGKTGLIDKNQNILIPCKYDSIELNHKTFAWVKKGSKWLLYNYHRKKLVSNNGFDKIYGCLDDENLEIVLKDSLWGIIDTNANYLVKPVFSEIQYCQEGLFLLTGASGQKQLYNSTRKTFHPMDPDINYLVYKNKVGRASYYNKTAKRSMTCRLIDSKGNKISDEYRTIFYPPSFDKVDLELPNFVWAIPLNQHFLIILNLQGEEFARF